MRNGSPLNFVRKYEAVPTLEDKINQQKKEIIDLLKKRKRYEKIKICHFF
jgi:hypothetical protein